MYSKDSTVDTHGKEPSLSLGKFKSAPRLGQLFSPPGLSWYFQWNESSSQDQNSFTSKGDLLRRQLKYIYCPLKGNTFMKNYSPQINILAKQTPQSPIFVLHLKTVRET